VVVEISRSAQSYLVPVDLVFCSTNRKHHCQRILLPAFYESLAAGPMQCRIRINHSEEEDWETEKSPCGFWRRYQRFGAQAMRL